MCWRRKISSRVPILRGGLLTGQPSSTKRPLEARKTKEIRERDPFPERGVTATFSHFARSQGTFWTCRASEVKVRFVDTKNRPTSIEKSICGQSAGPMHGLPCSVLNPVRLADSRRRSLQFLGNEHVAKVSFPSSSNHGQDRKSKGSSKASPIHRNLGRSPFDDGESQ